MIRFGRRLLSGVGVLTGVGCLPERYVPPALPAHQLARVQIESRAEVQSVDGRPLTLEGDRRPEEFWVGPGCHEVSVHYEETYVRLNGGVFFYAMNPAFVPLAAAATGAATLPHLQARNYSTDVPIRFYLPATAGAHYWLTSTFNGDEFQPRVVVLDEARQRKGTIIPDQPCGAPAQ